MIVKRRYIAFIFLLFIFLDSDTFGQRTYLDPTPTSGGFTSFNSGVASISTIGWVQYDYSGIVNSEVSTFIRVDIPNITPANFNSYLTVEVFDGNGAVTPTFSILKKASETYLVVTPCRNYTGVRISYFALLTTAKIYPAFIGFDPADQGAWWAVPEPPKTANSITFCQGLPSSITISNPICGLRYNWTLDSDLPVSGSQTSYTPEATLMPGPHTLKVTAFRPDAGAESAPQTVTITVNPKPIAPNIQPIN